MRQLLSFYHFLVHHLQLDSIMINYIDDLAIFELTSSVCALSSGTLCTLDNFHSVVLALILFFNDFQVVACNMCEIMKN